MRENGARLFRGLVFYVFIFNLTAFCSVLLLDLLRECTPLVTAMPEASWDGIISLTVVAVAGIFVWQYYALENRRHDLYMTAGEAPEGIYPEPRTLADIVFGSNRSMTAGTAVFCMAFTVLAQETAYLCEPVFEAVYNLFGFTAAYAPAATADYASNIYIILYAALAAPLAEEIVYRGLILKGLLPYGRSFAIVVSAVVFSLMHGDISQTFFTFLMGLLTAAVAAEYSIWWSFLVHFFNNGIYSGVLTAISVCISYEAAETAIIFLTYVSAAVFAVYIIRKRKALMRFIKDGRGVRGKAALLSNGWCALFAAFEIFETLTTLTRL